MPAPLDLTGQLFGRLTVTTRSGSINGKSAWEYLCSCGSAGIARGSDLVKGSIVSCGCQRSEAIANRNRTHGMCGTRAHTIWNGMRARCGDRNNPSFRNYGGRGVNVCERWQSFENFYADMGDPPAGCSIERVRNDDGYSPDNCVWATPEEQANNKRNNRILRIDGRRMTLANAARAFGLPHRIVRDRLHLGWTDEHALLTPVSKLGRKPASA